ncbi:tail completion protein gp17 [Szabonella alba]|uniref:DUF3168 domain-containing protein n=1 Tax=Szabonella alba TaxID=2804194 RepID=A0A8K0VCP8_9RHOB|nr:DUF3168 domain-containing protein [Szabonella alba]MBL4917450.1 DUF3168 domain-containing protein [Szabonella alba]
MIEPSLALQTVVRAALIGNPAVLQHVAPENIRAGSIRSVNMPGIVLAPARVEVMGRASGGQIVAEVRAMLHIWTVQDGSEVAQAIAGAVLAVLMDAPAGQGFTIDDWDRPELVWMPDPDPAQSCAHGAVALRAVLRWRVAA